MRKNIRKVIDAFLAHKAANGDSKRTCWTDGENIYSYSTKIAERMPNGLVRIRERNSTRTTNCQITAIMVAIGTKDCPTKVQRLDEQSNAETSQAADAAEVLGDWFEENGDMTRAEFYRNRAKYIRKILRRA